MATVAFETAALAPVASRAHLFDAESGSRLR